MDASGLNPRLTFCVGISHERGGRVEDGVCKFGTGTRRLGVSLGLYCGVCRRIFLNGIRTFRRDVALFIVGGDDAGCVVVDYLGNQALAPRKMGRNDMEGLSLPCSPSAGRVEGSGPNATFPFR